MIFTPEFLVSQMDILNRLHPVGGGVRAYSRMGDVVEVPNHYEKRNYGKLLSAFGSIRERAPQFAEYDPNAVAHVYALIDPRTDEVRYVGQSVYPLQRLHDHLSTAGYGGIKNRWLTGLLKEGLRPTLKILEPVYDEDKRLERERYWIDRLREEGHGLLNNLQARRKYPTPQAGVSRRRESLQELKEAEHYNLSDELIDQIATHGFWYDYKIIRRDGKEYGPYKYLRWRDETGKKRSKYLGKV